ncbi:MAG: HAD hydrolase-like protein [Bacteroidota bacterium]|nr:HAD hydrolase-like protein [Bacteroidota bacterium]
MEKPISVTTLFLDIGGVLLTNSWDREARKLAAREFNLDFDELDERHHLIYSSYEVGKVSLEEYLKLVVFYTVRDFSMDKFREFMFEYSKPYPEMIKLIYKLKDQFRLKVAAISNGGYELTKYRIKKFNLDNFIDFFISSSFVNYRKPDEEMYRIALDIAQVSREKVLYIEDRLIFIQIAGNLGITGIQHVDYRSTVAKLAHFGLQAD